MNKKDRKELERAGELLAEAEQIVTAIGEAEREKFDNMPKNLQGSERGQGFEECAEELEETAVEIDMARDNLESTIGSYWQ